MASLTVTRHKPLASALPPVWVTYIAFRDVWLLVEEYQVELPVEEKQILFAIPKDFEFDLASVPRIFWSLIGSFELSLVAPLIHDYLYQTHGMGIHHFARDPEGWEWPFLFTRKQADDLFLYLMLREGVPKWRAKLAHTAVRLFAPRSPEWPR